MAKCPQCEREADSFNDDGNCYRCYDNKRRFIAGLRHVGLDPLPGALLWKAYSPLAKIGDVEISHSHRGYWIAKGRVPLAVARELYADPAGKDLIRVAGHCCCPAPVSPWVEWEHEGKMVLRTKEKTECEGLLSSTGPLAEIARGVLDTCIFHDDPESMGATGFVDLYHIDGDLGLRVFADAIRRMIRSELLNQPLLDRENYRHMVLV